ncbi:hypothetical protein [Streptococcus suis]|nr:hypothetical protein [Streptococcus suis]
MNIIPLAIETKAVPQFASVPDVLIDNISEVTKAGYSLKTTKSIIA